MSSRARILVAAILVAAFVVAGVLLRGRGEGEGGPRDAAATSPFATGDGASRSAKHAGASQSRRIDRAAFVDAGVASPSDEAGAPPIPAHLRRVVVRLVFDDGHPLADVLVAAEAAKPDATDAPDDAARPEANDVDAWSEARGAVVHARTNADGRAAFRVPRGARFALTGGGGSSHAPFRSSVVCADAGDLVATVAARPVRVTVVDEFGGPVAHLTIEANGSAPVGDGKAWQITNAEGRAVFRGFAGRVRLSLDVDDGEFVPSSSTGFGEFAVEERGTFALPDAETRLVVRRSAAATARIVDRFGVPVERAAASATVVDSGGRAWTFLRAVTRSDGRVRGALPPDAVDAAAEPSASVLRLEVWTPGVTTPTVLSRPADPRGVNFGDVAVPTASHVKFRVVSAQGSPLVGATVEARSNLPADAPLSNPTCETDATGTAVLFEPTTEASFVVDWGLLRRVVTATEDARRPGGAGQTVVMPAVSALEFVRPPPGVEPGYGAGFEARWTDAATGEERGYCGAFSADGRATLPGMVPGTEIAVALSDCNGPYARLNCVAPSAGTVVEVPVAPPPPHVLRVRAVDAGGNPVAGFGTSLNVGAGAPPKVAPPDPSRIEWTTRCVGARSGEMLVRVEVGGVVTERRATLTPPSTEVVVRVVPPRTVRLVVRDPSSAQPDLASVAVDAGPCRKIEREELDARTVAFSTRAPRDEVVRFRVADAGEIFEVEADPTTDEVEFALPAAGTIVVLAARVPAAASLWVEAVPAAEGSAPVSTIERWGNADRMRRSEPLRVRPGRCSVVARLRFGYAADSDVVELGSRETTVVAGKETVVEF